MKKELFNEIRNIKANENIRRKKGERMMNKQRFKKVVSLLIAMFMLITMMPNALVNAEVDKDNKVNNKIEAGETPSGPPTTGSAIGTDTQGNNGNQGEQEQNGKLNLDLRELIVSLNKLGYKDNATITFKNLDTKKEYSTDASKTGADFKDADLGSYLINITSTDGKEFIINATIKQQGKEGESGISVEDNEFTFNTIEVNTPTLHFINVIITFSGPSITLEKKGTFIDVNNNKYADDEDTISYKFMVTNTGNVKLTGIALTDPKVTSITGNTTELSVGSEPVTFTAVYNIKDEDILAGKVDNTATVDSDQTVPVSDSTTVILPKKQEELKPEISLEKTGKWIDEGEVGIAEEGEEIEYSFLVTNEGNVKLTGINVTDPKVDVTGGSNLLEIGDDTTFMATYIITKDDIKAGKVDNTATVDSDQTEPVSDSTTVTLPKKQEELKPAISIEKTGKWIDEGEAGIAEEGEVIEYSFLVTNEGNVKLTGINVTDPKVDVTGRSNLLEIDNDTTFMATYIITKDDIKAGKVDNTATVDSDQTEPVSDSTTVTLPKKSTGSEDPVKPNEPKEPKDPKPIEPKEPEVVSIDDSTTPLGGDPILVPETPVVTPEEEVIAEQVVPLATTLPDTGSFFNTLTLIIIGAILVIAGLLLIKEEAY